MPLYKITVKISTKTNGIRFEKGMSVEVVSNSYSSPVTSDNGELVRQAFLRIYGVDIRKAGILNSGYLQVERIK